MGMSIGVGSSVKLLRATYTVIRRRWIYMDVYIHAFTQECESIQQHPPVEGAAAAA